MTPLDTMSEIAHGVAKGRLCMFGDKPKSLPQSVALVVVPQFTMMPLTSAIEPLRTANRLSEQNLYKWSLHSLDGQPVPASNGILTMVNGDLEGIPPDA